MAARWGYFAISLGIVVVSSPNTVIILPKTFEKLCLGRFFFINLWGGNLHSSFVRNGNYPIYLLKNMFISIFVVQISCFLLKILFFDNSKPFCIIYRRMDKKWQLRSFGSDNWLLHILGFTSRSLYIRSSTFISKFCLIYPLYYVLWKNVSLDISWLKSKL